MYVCAYVCLLVGAHVYARVCVEGQKTTLGVVSQVSSALVLVLVLSQALSLA